MARLKYSMAVLRPLGSSLVPMEASDKVMSVRSMLSVGWRAIRRQRRPQSTDDVIGDIALDFADIAQAAVVRLQTRWWRERSTRCRRGWSTLSPSWAGQPSSRSMRCGRGGGYTGGERIPSPQPGVCNLARPRRGMSEGARLDVSA